jgi:NitT/TauT family transport system substrate-binding protein
MVRIGHLSTLYHTSTLLMAQGGLPERLGTDVDWKLFGTGPAMVGAFERGELDLGYIGLPPAVIGIDRGVDIVCIAGGHIEGTVIAGESKLAGYPEARDLQAVLSQLAEARIGVPGKGSIHDVIIADALQNSGLAQEIEVINFKWADEALEAMAGGKISAVAGTPALAAAVKTYADGKILYPPSMLWPNNPSCGIIAGRRFLTKGSDLALEFLALHEEATAFLRQRPLEAARMISRYMGFVETEFVMDVLKISPKYCAQLTEGFMSSTMQLAAALRRLGYIRTEFLAPDRIFDTSLIMKVHPEKEHYGNGLSAA